MTRYLRTGPHSVSLQLTEQCNLHCRHCLADAPVHPGENELTTDEWIAEFDDLKAMGVYNVTVTGGELFARADVLQLLEALRERRFSPRLLTNATLIDRSKAQKLGELCITKVGVPLDGLRDTHDSVRGKGSFDAALAGIKYLREVGIQPTVSFVPMRHNVHDLAPLIDLLEAEGISLLHVETLRPEGRCLKSFAAWQPEFPDQLAIIDNTLTAKRSQYPNMHLPCYATFYLNAPGSYELHIASDPANTAEPKALMSGCSGCRESCVIKANGDVLPCYGLSTFVGGNIRHESLSRIWASSSAFAEIRRLGDLKVTAVQQCAKCRFVCLCNGGCRADAFAIYGDLLGPDPVCPYWHRPDRDAGMS